MKKKWAIAFPLALVAALAFAQAPGIKRTMLQKGDVPSEGAREVLPAVVRMGEPCKDHLIRSR